MSLAANQSLYTQERYPKFTDRSSSWPWWNTGQLRILVMSTTNRITINHRGDRARFHWFHLLPTYMSFLLTDFLALQQLPFRCTCYLILLMPSFITNVYMYHFLMTDFLTQNLLSNGHWDEHGICLYWCIFDTYFVISNSAMISYLTEMCLGFIDANISIVNLHIYFISRY